MGWREQQQAVLEVCTKDYHPHHLRFDAHACCFIDEESGKAWDEGVHPRGGDSKNPGRFSSGAGGGTVDEPTKRPEPPAIPPTRATGGVVRPQQESQTPKAPHPSSTADRSPLHQTMEKAPLKRADVLEGGANATSLLTLEDGTKAVFKTPAGESRDAGRSGVPFGTQYRREIAASRVADALGFGDLVPATTVRDQGGEVGSVQAFVADAYNTSEVDEPFDGGEDAARAAVFDYLVGHLDRHPGNWVLKDGKIALIDNGLSFPDAYHTDDFFNMEFWKHTQQEDLPMPDVSALEGKWPAVEKELRDSGIEDAAIGLAKQRYDAVVDGGKEYVSELPSLLGEEGGPTLGDMAQYYSRGARKDRHNAMVAEKERVFLEERKRAREARRAAAKAFDPNEPRDEAGKWTESGGGGDNTSGGEEKEPKPERPVHSKRGGVKAPKRPTIAQLEDLPGYKNGIVHHGGDVPFKLSDMQLKLVPVDKVYPTEDIELRSKVSRAKRGVMAGRRLPPIIVDRFGKVRDGHHRLEGAIQAGLTHIWALVQKHGPASRGR